MRLVTLFLAAVLVFGGSDGPFAGTWESTRSDAAGKMHIRLKPEPEITFTLGDREIKTKIASAKMTETGFDIDYDFTVEGYELRSSLKATLRDDRVAGEYRTTVRADGTAVDTGKFEAKAASN